MPKRLRANLKLKMKLPRLFTSQTKPQTVLRFALAAAILCACTSLHAAAPIGMRIGLKTKINKQWGNAVTTLQAANMDGNGAVGDSGMFYFESAGEEMSISARVASLQASYPFAKSGVMLRASTVDTNITFGTATNFAYVGVYLT